MCAGQQRCSNCIAAASTSIRACMQHCRIDLFCNATMSPGSAMQFVSWHVLDSSDIHLSSTRHNCRIALIESKTQLARNSIRMAQRGGQEVLQAVDAAGKYFDACSDTKHRCDEHRGFSIRCCKLQLVNTFDGSPWRAGRILRLLSHTAVLV